MRNTLVVAACLASSSCFVSVIERQCEKDLDCGSGWKCIALTCVPGDASPDGGTGGGAAGVGGGLATGGGTGGGGFGGGGATGGGSAPLCNKSNCISGCCAGNVCIPTSSQSITNCGTNGNACLSCNMNATCQGGMCIGGACDSQTCASGCCIGSQCIPPQAQNSLTCGVGGGRCQSCGIGGSCDQGTCVAPACDATTCPKGCCVAGQCIPVDMQSNGLCGLNGALCTSCTPSTQVCDNGTCAPAVCNASTCTNGCCSGNICIPFTAETAQNCGKGGSVCSSCPSGQVCTSGACVANGCNAQTCPSGCCRNGACVINDPAECGTGGATCATCPPGSQCSNGMCEGCGPMTCGMGCCQFGICQPGTQSFACGIGGNACQTCGTGMGCVGQHCQMVTTAQVGSACNTDSDCSNISPSAICKHFTSSGNAAYQGGYCTLRCGGTGSMCPSGSNCGSDPSAGESDNICLANCMTTSQCRIPGYACYSFPGNFNGCWIFPTPALDGGSVVPDGGARPTGAACSGASDCQPPSTAFCVVESLGTLTTGYLGGYCSRPCDASTSCPGGSVCITEVLGGTTATSSCKQVCSNPGGGQSTCRSGYICIQGPAGLIGWCGPQCFNQSFPCPSGGTCSMSGYCQ